MEAGGSYAIAAESDTLEPNVPLGEAVYASWNGRRKIRVGKPLLYLAAIGNSEERSLERAARAQCTVCK